MYLSNSYVFTDYSSGILLNHIRGKIKLSKEKILRQKAGLNKPRQRKQYKELARRRYILGQNYVEAKGNGDPNAMADYLSLIGHNLSSSVMSGRTDDYTETKRNSFVPHDENLDVSNWVNT